MPTYKQLYPSWDPDDFELVGASIVDEQTCVTAFKAATAAVRKGGGNCGCCGQRVQVYGRVIYKRMAKCLIWLVNQYNASGGEWISLKEGPHFRGGDNAKLIYWHLMVKHGTEKDRYKPTEIAVKFLRRELKLPKQAFVYNGKVLGFSREKFDLDDCLAGDFDMSDLGIPPWSEYG